MNNGDGQATFTAAVREHGPGLMRVARAILGNRQAAEDACQQAFLKAWGQMDQIQSLPGWLHRVVVHESFQVLRRQKVERQAMTRQIRADEPLGHTEQIALRESILLAMVELPETTREIVALRLLRGMTGNEVKNMLGCSASEVSRHLHEGMEQLREVLRDEQFHKGAAT